MRAVLISAGSPGNGRERRADARGRNNGADLQQGRSSDSAEELPELPSSRRSGADVAVNVQGRPAVGQAIKAAVGDSKMPPWIADRSSAISRMTER